MNQVLMSNYRRNPVVFTSGDGAWLTATDGRRFLDLVGGIAVNVLGHAHPVLVKAIAEQAATLIHTSNLYSSDAQVAVAEQLVATAFPGRVFFCNSGAEANEAAIKLARKWGAASRNGATNIICTEGAFHGRTLGALAATSEPRYRAPFEPLPAGFVRVPYDDAAAVAAAIDENTVAVMVEPILGEAGVVAMRDETLRALRDLCDQNNLLLIVDEIQTGMGRTGRWWCHQHAGIVPDVITVAKGLGGGVPVGALLANERADVFEPGDHGTTFGGNQLAMAAAGAVLSTIEADGLVVRARAVGERFRIGLETIKAGGAPIQEVRGRGLMLAVVLDRDLAPAVAVACEAVGVLVNPIGARVIRLLPALTISDADVDEALRRLQSVLAPFTVEAIT